MNGNLGIEYNSSCILIVSNCADETITIIFIDDEQPKVKHYYTWYNPCFNSDIESDIQEFLKNSSYDIEYEIELYRGSDFYKILKENEEL